MGILHKLVLVLRKLDPDNVQWRELQKQKALKEAAQALDIQAQPERQARLQEIDEEFECNSSDYGRKLYLIRECIYGVDIQPVAAQIAKLRFFISLMAEQHFDNSRPNRGVRALPNLETKFVAANTLMGLDFHLPAQDDWIYKPVRDLEHKLKAQRQKYFSANTRAKKKRLQENEHQLLEALRAELLKLACPVEQADKIVQWNPYDQNASAGFFDAEWMFGILTGFDIVIGNPPYVQVKKGIFSPLQFPYSEGKDKGKQNLYKVFVEQSFNLLKDGGVSCLIAQSSLMADISAQFTRELLLTKTKIKFFVEFPKKSKASYAQVFESVLQGTCICNFVKNKPNNDEAFLISSSNNINSIRNLQFEEMRQSIVQEFYPNSFFIPLIKKGDFKIMQLAIKNSKPLIEFMSEIRQGDLNLTTAKNYFSTVKTPVKLYRGKHIQRYKLIPETEEYVSSSLLRENVKNNQNMQFIVGQEVTGTTDKWRLHFCLTNKNEGFLFGHTANKILLKDERNNKFVLAMLNSKFMDWFFRKTSTNNHVMGYEIEQMPIPKIPAPDQQPFIELVDKILANKKAGIDTRELEKQIDALVYALYGLTEEEIKIVETTGRAD